ncbi:glycosyltransferase [Sessilibacter corallicola]|uniref:glycosyltransferase n=1 Tax=Sessilibacter corallicola TaxID=2904075 RepID=UPI001E369FAD|nr:glycosyltransferase [Sessilibacter corallicola]MCE2028160.1 glycosyltransferase [Sessilibacter corallicola]
MESPKCLGAVIIGRNEGDRLKACLRSTHTVIKNIVYVDSGSTDGSIEFAESMGVSVVNLDTSIPFSAARARNEGFRQLLKEHPETEYVQFVDGDCQVADGWLEAAYSFLENDPSCAIVCGRRQEKFPEASLYNLFCDIEWDTPVGEAGACGGDFLGRVEALEAVEGFNPSVIAGEEPEMCFRLREKNWKIFRIDHLMTHHDAQMTEFQQWWQRAKRCGHAYAQGFDMHGMSPEKYYRREVKSAITWGGVIPVLLLLVTGLAIVGLTPPFSLVLWLLPAVLFLKVLKYSLGPKKLPFQPAVLYSLSLVVAKIPELVGVQKYYQRKRKNSGFSIIEYK